MIDRSDQKLDNYRLLKLLGRGSFGEVYLAKDVVRRTRVAIKIFNIDSKQVHGLDGHPFLWQIAIKVFKIDSKQVHQPDMVEEIRNLVRLNGHPNIIRISDFSVKPPEPFIVMDYAPNGTLATKHPRGMSVPLATVMVYVKQIASALQYAHERNLIHRDVKPANILIAQDGRLLLSDFGITIPSQSILVANGGYQDFAGTPEYMAPEQIQSLSSRASDQYALAILVYEWLTGYPPFMGNWGDILKKHLLIPPAPLPRTVSSELAAVLMKALSKNPKDRYSTIQQFASALEQAYDGVLQRSQTPTLIEKPPLPAMNKKSKEQWAREGYEHSKAKRYDEAIAAYSKAIELDSAYAVAYNNRGAAYNGLKRYKEAIRDYNKSIELDPAFARAYNNRGTAHYDLKQYEEAVRDCSKAIELDPAFAVAYNNRGAAYDVLKNYKQAIADYDRAFALDSNYTPARENRERALQRLQAENSYRREEEPKKPTSVWQEFGLEE